jgi:hypothetical protein
MRQMTVTNIIKIIFTVLSIIALVACSNDGDNPPTQKP